MKVNFFFVRHHREVNRGPGLSGSTPMKARAGLKDSSYRPRNTRQFGPEIFKDLRKGPHSQH